jgi:hypothetical protein
MKMMLLTSIVVVTTFVSSLFTNLGTLTKSIITVDESQKSVIVVTGDNTAAVAENISTYLNENYSNVEMTLVEEEGRVDTIYKFSSNRFGDRKLRSILATSQCVKFYKDLLGGPYTSFCGLVGHRYVYHLKGMSIDNSFTRFAGNNYSITHVYDLDPGPGECSKNGDLPLGELVRNISWNPFTMNDRISCLDVYHP